MMREHWTAGDSARFDYRCWESDESADAPAWHRTGQLVKILGEAPNDAPDGSTADERAEIGQPRVYRVRFPDGLVWDAFEDELTV